MDSVRDGEDDGVDGSGFHDVKGTANEPADAPVGAVNCVYVVVGWDGMGQLSSRISSLACGGVNEDIVPFRFCEGSIDHMSGNCESIAYTTYRHKTGGYGEGRSIVR